MRCFRLFALALLLQVSFLSAAEFTIGSYNCGGLSDHYDYLRAVATELVMKERHMQEPEYMALNEKIQRVALKILFSQDATERAIAKEEWDRQGYEELFNVLTKAPNKTGSINSVWATRLDNMLTPYNIRPVVIYDKKMQEKLSEHLTDLCKKKGLAEQELLQEARAIMAKRIFAEELPFDIICLQEADYLDASMFPEHYEILLSKGDHLKNGLAWNRERFELVNTIGESLKGAFAALFRDKETEKTVLIASGHIKGCNPYYIVENPETGIADSAAGDQELQALVEFFEAQEADIKIIGMDSNVTAMHPRLHILKNGGYQMDSENYLDPTCTNPYQVLNTRIDWIVLKSNLPQTSIVNIPVLSVGLNNIRTNMSDHKPIAAKIGY